MKFNFNKILYNFTFNLLILTCIFFASYISVYSAEQSCFEIYAGQGNFNRALIETQGRKFALYFDVGISSQQCHEKFHACTEEAPFLTPNAETPLLNSSKRKQRGRDDRELAYQVFMENKAYKDASAQKHTSRNVVDGAIASAISAMEVDFAICFISHGDRDHWNKIHLLSDDVPTFILVNGGIASTKFKDDVMKRKNAILVDTSEFPPIFDTGFGTFMKDRVLTEEYNFSCLLADERCTDIKSELLHTVEGLNNIHLWCLNPNGMTDINGRSYVISCRFPKIKTSVICTGDATPKTFREIINNVDPKSPAILEEMHYSTFMMLAHHGSWHNIDESFFLFVDALKVNAFIAPAGNGAQYGHPSKIAIDRLMKIYEDESKYQPIACFWDKYTCKGQLVGTFTFEHVAAFGCRYKAYMHDVVHGKIPIFGTNLMGNIKLKEDGSWTSRKSFVIKVEDVEYEANLVKRLATYQNLPEGFEKVAEYQQFIVGKVYDVARLFLKIVQFSESYHEYALFMKSPLAQGRIPLGQIHANSPSKLATLKARAQDDAGLPFGGNCTIARELFL